MPMMMETVSRMDLLSARLPHRPCRQTQEAAGTWRTPPCPWPQRVRIQIMKQGPNLDNDQLSCPNIPNLYQTKLRLSQTLTSWRMVGGLGSSTLSIVCTTPDVNNKMKGEKYLGMTKRQSQLMKYKIRTLASNEQWPMEPTNQKIVKD